MKYFLVFFSFFFFFSCCFGQEYKCDKKVIHLGWEQPSPKILKENFQHMELTSPFDGIVIGLRDTVNGHAITDATVFGSVAFKKEWLFKSLTDIKSCNFKKFKSNFLRIYTTPGNIRWDDDVSWQRVVKNFGVMAWFAKSAGLKGFCYDPESYLAKQFSWSPSSKLTFTQTQALAKLRGKQIMNEVAKEFPEIVFWGLFMYSYGRPSLNSKNIQEVMQTDQYGLYTEFINGMLEALPLKAKMVEGNEEGYYAKTDLNLYSLYHDSRVKALKQIPASSHIKFKNQYSVGFGLYVDMYTNDKGDRYYHGELPNRSRLDRFRDRLATAVELADEYVWVYNEKYRWWNLPYAKQEHNSHLTDTLCEEKLPGITNAVLYAKNPLKFVENSIQKYSNLRNFAMNPGFDDTAAITAKQIKDWSNIAMPPGFLSWKSSASEASASVTQGKGINGTNALVVKGKGDFSIIQSINVEPGESYIISVKGKKNGTGKMQLNARWTDNYNHLVDWYLEKNMSFNASENDTWLTATTIVTVPDEIKKMHLFIDVTGYSKYDEFMFDNLIVYKLHDFFKNNF
jgi:hypothetical protein